MSVPLAAQQPNRIGASNDETLGLGEPTTKKTCDIEAATLEDMRAMEARILENVESTVGHLLRTQVPKLVQGIIADQLKNIRESECLDDSEFAVVRNALEKVQNSGELPTTSTVGTTATSAAYGMLATKDAEDMMSMLNAYRTFETDGEKSNGNGANGNAATFKRSETDAAEQSRIQYLIVAWVHTWRNRRTRYPKIGHRRAPASLDVNAKTLALENVYREQKKGVGSRERGPGSAETMNKVRAGSESEGDDDAIDRNKSYTSEDALKRVQSRQSYGSEDTQEDADDEVKKLIEVYAWVESVWDIAMFIGSHGHPGQSVYNALLVFFNVFLQIALCLIINDTFTQPLITQTMLNDLRLWRTTMAHDVEWLDPLTDETLIDRICNGHTVLSVSSSVSEIFQMTMEYTGKKDMYVQYDENPVFSEWWLFDHHYIGVWLSLMSCAIWWMIVSQDILHMLDLQDAIRGLPVHRTVIRKYGHNRALSSLSRRRRTSIYSLLFLRFLVCLVMLSTGTCFMLYTVSLTDLLLNAAALSIILELDNLIFVAFAPGQARALIGSLLPLARPHDKKVFGVSLRYPIMLVGMICLALTLGYTILIPQANDVEKAQIEICGGNLDFVSSIAQNGAVVAATNDLRNKYEQYSSTYRFKAMRQLIETKDGDSSNDYISYGMSTPSNSPDRGDLSGISVGVLGPSYSMKSISSMAVEDITHLWNTDCSDAPGLDSCTGTVEKGCWQIFVMHNTTHDTSISSCADIKKYCGADSLAGVRARQFCPKTCGCDNPFAESLYPSMSMGCPKTCENENRETILASATCVNSALGSWQMQNYLSGVTQTMEYYPSGQKDFALPVQEALVAGGCSAAFQPIDSFGYAIDLCSGNNWFHWKTLSMVCPQSCGCANRTAVDLPAGCPRSCVATR